MEKNFKAIKRIFCLIIILGQLVVLASCLSNSTEDSNSINNPNDSQTGDAGNNDEQSNSNSIKVWQNIRFDLFDTVSYVFSYKGDSVEEFTENSNNAFAILEEYHKLFDIYHEYNGIVNLATINKNAGKEAMTVDYKLVKFLKYAKEIYSLTKGETNVMLGPVLKLWHDARTAKDHIPSMESLQNAYKYSSIDLLEIDEVNNTVRIKDVNGRIDVGALGKGYATEKVAEYLESIGCTSYVLNFGGNLRVIGTRTDGTGWNTGVTNPFGDSQFSLYLNIKDTACVTSGDYERFYVYEGKKYHHIIDKDTLMPAEHFTSITILTKDSGLADALSTALFTMPYEEGVALINSLEDVEAIWIFRDKTIKYTDGVIPISL